MKKNIENYYIDFYRFVFSITILLYHSWKFVEGREGICNYGFYGVDFYFIVTGYLMMSSVSKIDINTISISKTTIKYIIHKYMKLFPALLITFIFGCIFVYGRNLFDIKLLLSNQFVGEFFQLSILGYEFAVNDSWWYMSSMFFVILILYPLALKFQEKYIYLIIPLILFVAISLINCYNINVNNPGSTTLIFRNGFYKGLIFIVLGNISFILSNKIRQFELSDKRQTILTIIETTIYLLLILNMRYNFIGSLLVAILFTINIATTFSNKTKITKYFKSDIWKKLGTYGFYIYLIQLPVRSYFLRHNHFSYTEVLIRYVITSLALSLFCYLIIDVVTKKFKERITKQTFILRK